MGTLLASLHEEHKARQARIRMAAFKAVMIPQPEPAAPEPRLGHMPVPEPLIEAITEAVIVRGVNKSIFDIILDEVCAYYSLRKIDLFSNRRMNNISAQRHMLIYMIYQLTNWTSYKIAAKVDRDPSSVTYAIAKIANNLGRHQEQIFQLQQRIAPLLAQKKAMMCQS